MKLVKNIILGCFKPQLIPVTLWTESHKRKAEFEALALENIPLHEKTDAQEDLQNRLSDMLEDYNDIHSK